MVRTLKVMLQMSSGEGCEGGIFDFCDDGDKDKPRERLPIEEVA